jgi:hypothetical protein
MIQARDELNMLLFQKALSLLLKKHKEYHTRMKLTLFYMNEQLNEFDILTIENN